VPHAEDDSPITASTAKSSACHMPKCSVNVCPAGLLCATASKYFLQRTASAQDPDNSTYCKLNGQVLQEPGMLLDL
jgi:hypothetical protein